MPRAAGQSLAESPLPSGYPVGSPRLPRRRARAGRHRPVWPSFLAMEFQWRMARFRNSLRSSAVSNGASSPPQTSGRYSLVETRTGPQISAAKKPSISSRSMASSPGKLLRRVFRRSFSASLSDWSRGGRFSRSADCSIVLRAPRGSVPARASQPCLCFRRGSALRSWQAACSKCLRKLFRSWHRGRTSQWGNP